MAWPGPVPIMDARPITAVEYRSQEDIDAINEACRLLHGVMRRNIPKEFTFADRLPTKLTADGIAFLKAKT